MKLSKWAKQNGVSYWTAWKWFRDGNLPVEAIQTKSGTILVQQPEQQSGKIAIYARVSSSDQRPDLDRQVARLASWA
jgi:putative resolvase